VRAGYSPSSLVLATVGVSSVSGCAARLTLKLILLCVQGIPPQITILSKVLQTDHSRKPYLGSSTSKCHQKANISVKVPIPFHFRVCYGGLVDQSLSQRLRVSYLVIIRTFPHLALDGTVYWIKTDHGSGLSEAVRFGGNKPRRYQPH
jgi:hypothetical protein